MACVLLLLANAKLLKNLAQALGLRGSARSPQQSATIYYERTTTALAKRGWRKAAGQTATEFMEEISDLRIRESVTTFTKHYEQARFDASQEDAEQLPKLYAEITAKRR